MGTLEEKSKIRTRHTRIQDGLILALYGTTLLSMALLAPNALALLKNIDPDLSKKRKPSYRIQQALKRLELRGLVKREKVEVGWKVALTPRGEKFADQLHNAERIMIRKPRRWDGKWRVVIFDIWERRKGVRERLRRLLIKAGFLRIQDSVWTHPYDCEELITFIRSELKLGNGLLYLIADGIEQDKKLKTRFGLE